MPFQSQDQRKWMWANKPKMAKEWEVHTPEGPLPDKKKPNRKKRKGLGGTAIDKPGDGA